jgi:biotin carboxyl carrier protein
MSAKPTGSFILDDAVYETALTRKFKRRKRWSPPDPSKVVAHIPGLIQKVHAAPGTKVQAGTPLLVLEAMKMQNDVCAHGPAVVAAVHVKDGDLVAKGQLLMELELP